MKAALPANEAERLQALRSYHVLDTLEEQAFDDLTRLAAELCGTPIALISLVDDERQWFKSRVGLQATQTPREHAFCAHAILRPEEVLLVPDATSDPRFADNPLVTDAPGIRFYAGAPLVTPGGHALGTLCVIDKTPRALPSAKVETLAGLARLVVAQLELHRLAQQLDEDRERLALALAGSRLAMFDWDVASGRVQLSEQWSAMLGGPSAETHTRIDALRALVHPDDAAALGDRVRTLLEGRVDYYDVEHRVRDGRGGWTWIRSRAKVTARDAAGRALRILGTNSDISERKRLEQMKADFISVASHELRTPLTSLAVSLNLLREGSGGTLPEQARAFVDIACENSDRLVALVNDLLDMERIDSGRLEVQAERVELEPLLQEAVRLHAAYAERLGVRYVATSEPQAAVVADRERCMQVLANLLSNAAKFSPPGSEVRIEACRQAGVVRISVIDRGRGIAPEFRARIFEKFAQAESGDARRKGGSGLGLAITKGLVEAMGGRIGFDSESGRGTTFWVELPAA